MPSKTFSAWRKSSYSGDSNSCVEWATTTHLVGVRDSKQPVDAPLLTFEPAQWMAFIQATKRHSFNR